LVGHTSGIGFDVRVVVFTTVKSHGEIFWVVMPWNIIVENQCSTILLGITTQKTYSKLVLMYN